MDQLFYSPSYALYRAVLSSHLSNQLGDITGVDEALHDAQSIITAHPIVMSTPTRCDDLHRLFFRERNGFDPVSIEQEDGFYDAMEDDLRAGVGLGRNATLNGEHILYHSFRDILSLPIHWICCIGSDNRWITILSKTVIAEYENTYEDPIHTAICFGHVDIIKFLFERYPKSMESTTNDGSTCFHTCAWVGHIHVMRLLIESKRDGASIVKRNGQLPLHIAMNRRNYHLVPLLLDAYPKGSIIKNTSTGLLPLLDATRTNNIPLICCLLHKLSFEGLFQPIRYTYPSFDLSIPKELWNRRNTAWSTIFDRCGKERTIDIFMEAQQYPLRLHDAIGVVPIQEIDFILQSIPSVDLRLCDNDGRNVLLTTIYRALEEHNRQYWDVYYRKLIDIIIKALQKQFEKKEVSTMMIDGSGRRILHIASENGLPCEGIQALMKADANASYMPDAKSLLLPFMIAAADDRSRLRRKIQGQNVLQSDLTTVYVMIRFSPDVFKRMPVYDVHHDDASLNGRTCRWTWIICVMMGLGYTYLYYLATLEQRYSQSDSLSKLEF